MLVQVLVGVGEMNMAVSSDLAKNVIKTEKQECAAGQARKPVANGAADAATEPCDAKTKDGCGDHMAAAGQRGHRDGLAARPALDPGGEHKRQPVSRNRRVKEGDAETGNREGG